MCTPAGLSCSDPVQLVCPETALTDTAVSGQTSCMGSEQESGAVRQGLAACLMACPAWRRVIHDSHAPWPVTALPPTVCPHCFAGLNRRCITHTTPWHRIETKGKARHLSDHLSTRQLCAQPHRLWHSHYTAPLGDHHSASKPAASCSESIRNCGCASPAVRVRL